MAAPNQTVEKIAAARPTFTAEEIEQILPAVREVLESGWLILGKHTQAFEEAFRAYVGVEHAVALSTCSAATQITLRFFGVQGREVIMPTNNFPGVVSSVLYEGGIPVLADMEPSTFCLDTEDALRRISSRTAGIIVVHLAGLVYPDIDDLRGECHRRGLFLIEDAAHAHGASIGGRKAGSLADAGVFSFYPTKIMTSCTGGMITTSNPKLADYARLLRHHGQGKRREDFVEMGSDWVMSEIHAILGLQQLAGLDDRVDHRNQVVQWYREGLADEDWITIPRYPGQFRHAYYKLPTLVAEDIDPNLLRRILEVEHRIENGTVYDPPCHRQLAFRDVLEFVGGAYPKADRALARQLCPPIHEQVTREHVDRVVDAMLSTVGRCRIVPGSRRE
jgi:dTDP-4-amino-4,6-dideoxygalactose transaminase